jgi:phosphohistidine phosphatase
MKTLFLFRHAKSDWEADFDHDHDRPLNKRGKRAAKRMGRYLAEAGGVPGLVVTSSAFRAWETVRLAAEAGAWKCEIDVADELYEAATDGITNLVQRQPDTHDSVLLAGHEPGFSGTVSRLMGGGQVRMPTAAIACLEFDVERWSDVQAGGGRLVWLVTPKMLADE